MGSLKYLALVALLFSLSLAVFADKSNDATHHGKDDWKPSEATDTNTIEPQQRGRGGCRLGCAGMGCCSQPQAAKTEAEAKSDVGVDPELIRWRGCKYGCCGGKRFGRCKYCCPHPRTVETVESESVQQAKP